ncbi:DegT/DnrJ/EryC1/StrS family aminotransferase [Verrucomicrobiales bacterium]|nr:DegT/DnrJ/EryC1/StrS family aminotransferase [Verrucomicrobiales bacterium]MDC0275394.1 DegT/DnrJ/EryC1/StrS family aminotransferase [Verrucomicrobiales bacterium]
MKDLFQRVAAKVSRIVRRQLTPLRSPLRVGIIGYGEIGPDHILGYEASGLAQVVAVADIQPLALARAKWKYPHLRTFRDYRQMLSECSLDAVSICTWPDSHAAVAEVCMASGIGGILCEKPLTLSMSEIKSMSRVSEKTNTKIGTGLQNRFHPCFLEAADIIRAGKLGEINKVTGYVRGVLFDTGVHLIDAIRFLLGDPEAESIDCKCVRETSAQFQGYSVENGSYGTINLTTKVPCYIKTGNQTDEFFLIRIEGENDWLEVKPSGLKTGSGDKLTMHDAKSACRRLQFSQFVNWVKGRISRYSSDFHSGAKATEWVLALYESARLNETVIMPLENLGDVVTQLYEKPSFIPIGPQGTKVESIPRLAWDGGKSSISKWYSRSPEMGWREACKMAEVIISKKLNCTEGGKTRLLEKAFTKMYGSKYSIASSSGTAAIHVAVGALGLNPGDEVITSPVTDMGTVLPILASNCLPIFADVDPVTGHLTAESIRGKITSKTRAVIVVHLAGRPAELGEIMNLINEKEIFLIEDCAQCHYADFQGRKVGTFGDFGCFSLQQSKQITCGDGGMTLCNDEKLAERAALFADKGWRRSGGQRNHYFFSLNYRMTELQAGVALAQMTRLPSLIERRRLAANRLTELLEMIPGVKAPSVPVSISPSWHFYIFSIDEEELGVSIEDFLGAIQVEGIRAKLGYLPKPIFEYDVIKKQKTFGESGYPFTAFPYVPPRTEEYPGFVAFNRQILLFWSHNVTEKFAEQIAAAITKVATCFSENK